MPQQDHEITEKDFEKEINRCILGFSEGVREDVINKCFELAKSYHSQRLREAGEGLLPDAEQIQIISHKIGITRGAKQRMEIAESELKELCDKASSVLAGKDEMLK